MPLKTKLYFHRASEPARAFMRHREQRIPALFHGPVWMKQNGFGMKPFLAFGEGVSKPLMVTNPVNNKGGPQRPAKSSKQGTVMIKALSVIAIAAFVAAALTLLPGFAPQVEASVPQPLPKADRLDIRPVGRDCSEQAWPNFEASCLRAAGTKREVRQARLVTADRTP
jgi:hypothetical protein